MIVSMSRADTQWLAARRSWHQRAQGDERAADPGRLILSENITTATRVGHEHVQQDLRHEGQHLAAGLRISPVERDHHPVPGKRITMSANPPRLHLSGI